MSNSKVRTLACIATLSLGIAQYAHAQGNGKPGGGGGGTPTGTIYYYARTGVSGSNCVYTFYKANPDGTGKTALFTELNLSVAANLRDQVSFSVHNGKRWFVRMEDSDVNGIYHVVFSSEAGASHSVAVNWGALDTTWYDGSAGPAYLAWVPGDSKVSFIGRIDTAGNGSGVYTFDVVYDANNEPTGVTNSQPVPGFAMPTKPDATFGTIPQTGSYCWKADGSAVAVGVANDTTHIYRLDSAGWRTIYSGPYNVLGPISWGSTDKLAFGAWTSSSSAALFTMPSGGGALTQLDSVKFGRNAIAFQYPQWSPDGAFISYNYEPSSDPPGSAVRRVNSGGGGVVTIVANTSVWMEVVGWR